MLGVGSSKVLGLCGIWETVHWELRTPANCKAVVHPCAALDRCLCAVHNPAVIPQDLLSHPAKKFIAHTEPSQGIWPLSSHALKILPATFQDPCILPLSHFPPLWLHAPSP